MYASINGRKYKILGVLILYNSGRYDLTEVQVVIDIGKLVKKYGRIPLRFIDEYGNVVKFSYVDDNYNIVEFNNWESSNVIISLYKITAKQRIAVFILKDNKDSSSNVFDHYSNSKDSKESRDYNYKLFLGSRIYVLDKYRWDIGHSQSIVKLGDYLYISTILRDNELSKVYKLDSKTLNILGEVVFKEDSRYHISGISEDKSGDFIYVALAEYSPNVKKPTIIYKLYHDLTYERFFEVEDHIGAICSSRRYIYMFNWDAEKLYIYDKYGKPVKIINKKGWGPIQDCDYSYGKIYGTSQNHDRIDIIETKTFNVINRIYTPKGFTNEGFDIDSQHPDIFWFLPDDGYIYKTKYQSVSGYNIFVSGNKYKLSIHNPRTNSTHSIIFDRGALEFYYSSDSKSDYYKIYNDKDLGIILKVNRIILHNKDLFFNYGLVNFKNSEVLLNISGDVGYIKILKYSKKVKYKLIVL